MIDARMIRWITASVNKHFDDLRAGDRLYIEGQEIDLANQTTWAELRFTGPRQKEFTPGNYHFELDINIMCSAKVASNIYNLQNLVGKFQAAMDQEIDVYRYGDGDAYIGCFLLRNDVPHPLDVIPWGLVTLSGSPISVNQTSIDGYYVMEI